MCVTGAKLCKLALDVLWYVSAVYFIPFTKRIVDLVPGITYFSTLGAVLQQRISVLTELSVNRDITG